MKKKSILWLTGGLLVASGWAGGANAAGRCLPHPDACEGARASAPAPDTARSGAPAWADGRGAAVVMPIDSTPAGQSYGRWAAQWWQWALGIPAEGNPLLDTTGANCDRRQVGDVWFLAGGFEPVTRSCSIPAGKALFFPLINIGYFAFLNDSADTRTAAYVRSAGSCTMPARISVWIDGSRVERPTRFFTGPTGSDSPLFNVQMPPGNLFGGDESTIPELALSPSAEQGYYLFVQPMRPGAHTIRWTATGCTAGNTPQDITYYLKVTKE